MIDVALTNPLQSEASMARAAEAPGGHATSYEGHKYRKYANHLRPGQILVPFIIDTFGALSTSARNYIKKVVPHFAYAGSFSQQVAARLAKGRITTAVIREVAAFTLKSTTQRPGASTLPGPTTPADVSPPPAATPAASPPASDDNDDDDESTMTPARRERHITIPPSAATPHDDDDFLTELGMYFDEEESLLSAPITRGHGAPPPSPSAAPAGMSGRSRSSSPLGQ